MDDSIARSAPMLYEALKEADEANRKKKTKKLPKYDYDPHVVLAHEIAQFSRYGISFAVPRTEGIVIGEIEQQKATGKKLFGGGILVSDQIVKEREKAEREKAEREKAERKEAVRWTLSEKERAIIAAFPICDEEKIKLF